MLVKVDVGKPGSVLNFFSKNGLYPEQWIVSYKFYLVMKLTHLTLIFLLLWSLDLFAQQPPFRNYFSNDYERFLKENMEDKEKETQIRNQKKSIEQYNSEFMKYGIVEPKIIPVVFHIDRSGLSGNITLEDIQTQLDVLNDCFAGVGAHGAEPKDANEIYGKLAVDTEIQFCLPASPIGEASFGINFIAAAGFDKADLNTVKSTLGGATPWDTEKYLNIWVTPLADTISGYAQLPGNEGLTDGIVIHPYFFGVKEDKENPFGGGKTLAHLVGTYLGLYPLWGGENCQDDFVQDTPVHNDPNYGVPGENHVTTCDGNAIEMTINIMDNSDDNVAWMFTQGQKLRMHATLSEKGFRSQLGKDVKVLCDPTLEMVQEEAIEEVNAPLGDKTVLIYPNPAARLLNIEVSSDLLSTAGKVEIFDQQGKRVDLFDASPTLQIDVQDWAAGIYLVHFSNGADRIIKKIVITTSH